MLIEFANQCCDAHTYLGLGQVCAQGIQCWHALRPLGAVLYFTLPFLYGLPAETLIVQNAICVLVSAVCAVAAMTTLLPASTRAGRAALTVSVFLAHAFFMERVVYTSLSDVPAAAAAMMSIWLLILGRSRREVWFGGGAGLALGLAVSFRAYYLYPALVAALCLLLLAAFHKVKAVLAAPFCIALALPIALQFYATHSHTGEWTFIDQRSIKLGEAIHFETVTYGYDTLFVNDNASGIRYDAPACFRESRGMGDAVRKRKWGELVCLVAHRQWYYFGSFIAWGEVYLTDPAQRHFSKSFFAFNAVALLVAATWLFRQVRRAWPLAMGIVLLGAVWGEGSLIIPESRFLMLFHVVLWTFAAAGICDRIHWLRNRLAPGWGRRALGVIRRYRQEST